MNRRGEVQNIGETVAAGFRVFPTQHPRIAAPTDLAKPFFRSFLNKRV